MLIRNKINAILEPLQRITYKIATLFSWQSCSCLSLNSERRIHDIVGNHTFLYDMCTPILCWHVSCFIGEYCTRLCLSCIIRTTTKALSCRRPQLQNNLSIWSPPPSLCLSPHYYLANADSYGNGDSTRDDDSTLNNSIIALWVKRAGKLEILGFKQKKIFRSQWVPFP